MYMLIYPYANTSNINELTYESFTKLECILISKKAIWKTLENYGINKEYLIGQAKKLWETGLVGKHKIKDLNWCYLYLSDSKKYSETPVNIVIRREKLIELSNQIFLATPNKVVLGKGEDKGLVIETTLFGKFIRRMRNN